MSSIIRQLSIILVVLSMVPLCSEAATITVDCDAGEKIQQTLGTVRPGDEIMVSGTCNEAVFIVSEIMRVTLNGQGKAKISSARRRKSHSANFSHLHPGEGNHCQRIYNQRRVRRNSSIRRRRWRFGYY